MIVLPVENDTGDAALDWTSQVSPAILDYDLTGSRKISVFRTTSRGAIASFPANRLVEGYLSRPGGNLALHLTIEDPSRNKTLRIITLEGRASDGIVPLLDRAAKDLSATSRTFVTHDTAALKAYAQSLEAPDLTARVQALETSLAQDPKFVVGYTSLAETLLQTGDRTKAAEAAAQGLQTATSNIDRAQLQYLAATAGNDLNAREEALAELMKLTGATPEALQTMAQLHTLQRRFTEAIEDTRELARLTPGDPAVYNQLGYLKGYTHDLNGATEALARYAKLVPVSDPNPSDSQGEVEFMLGNFKAAERDFLEANKKGAAIDLLKAAQARMMAGDLEGADSLFEKYTEAIKGGPASSVDFQRSRWEFITGRRRSAMDRLEKMLASPAADAVALAGSQLAVWHLQTGDRPAAARYAAIAASHATTPVARNLAGLGQFLAAPAPRSSPFPLINGAALILDHQPAEAIGPLQQTYFQTIPAVDGEVRTLLASAYLATSKTKEASGLIGLYPLPLTSSESLLTSLEFPQFLKVRAAVLKAEQKTNDARQSQDLYEKYAGDVPDRF